MPEDETFRRACPAKWRKNSWHIDMIWRNYVTVSPYVYSVSTTASRRIHTEVSFNISRVMTDGEIMNFCLDFCCIYFVSKKNPAWPGAPQLAGPRDTGPDPASISTSLNIAVVDWWPYVKPDDVDYSFDRPAAANRDTATESSSPAVYYQHVTTNIIVDDVVRHLYVTNSHTVHASCTPQLNYWPVISCWTLNTALSLNAGSGRRKWKHISPRQRTQTQRALQSLHGRDKNLSISSLFIF